ncbi:MAG: diguanylate cyclase [Nitrospirae bacterium]|nr:diguanylate cyclase [Nitrospirota bacterium]
MEKIILITDKPEQGKGLFSRVLSLDSLDLEALKDFEAVFIEAADAARVEDTVRGIKDHHDINVYLKPLFLLVKEQAKDERLAGLLDGTIVKGNTLEESIKAETGNIRGINKKIQDIAAAGHADDNSITTKILRYLFSRGRKLSPIRSVRSRFGYFFPALNAYHSKEDIQVFTLLDFMKKEQLLSGVFRDRIHLCNYCNSAFLNFRETCPLCKSADLIVNDLVHHFVCGYTGPETDFRQENRTVCPKCRTELKHIGVDFDRPSVVYECAECKEVFQEPAVDSLCIACGKTSSADDLVTEDIEEYDLTSLGRNAAFSGIDMLFVNILKKEVNVLSLDTFKEILNLEVLRIKRYKNVASSITALHMDNLDRIQTELGSKGQSVFMEIAKVIRGYVRETDVVTMTGNSLYLFLFIETPLENVQGVMDRLKKSVEKPLTDNLNFSPSIRTISLPVDGKADAAELINNLLKAR